MPVSADVARHVADVAVRHKPGRDIDVALMLRPLCATSDFGGDPNPVLVDADPVKTVQLVERVTQVSAELVLGLVGLPAASVCDLGDVGAADSLKAVRDAGRLVWIVSGIGERLADDVEHLLTLG